MSVGLGCHCGPVVAVNPGMAQPNLAPRRQVIFSLLAKRQIRLVIQGGLEGASFTAAGLRSRYAVKNPPEALDPMLVFDPPFAAEEHKELEVFSREMGEKTAKANGYRILRRKKEFYPNGQRKVIASQPADRVSLFTNTSKMACGSWSLPAGGPLMGGTCPSANTMQAVARVDPVQQRHQAAAIPRLATALASAGTGPRRLPMAPEPASFLSAERNICDACYAAKGNYGVANTQIWQMARFAWCWTAVKEGRFVHEMTAALGRYLSNLKARKSDKTDPRFFRLHDSGDFFSPEYLAAWAEVCRKFPLVHFWAPTRVWMLWPDQLAAAMRRAPNLVIRPSALQFDDPAPQVPRVGTAGSSGSAVVALCAVEPARRGVAAWDCPAYALESHTCAGALDPANAKTPEEKAYNAAARANYKRLIGQEAPKDCRWCWTHRDQSVSYHAH